MQQPVAPNIKKIPKLFWIQSGLIVFWVELSIYSKVKQWSKGEVRSVCNTCACECYTKNSSLTVELAIFCWLCGFIDTQWLSDRASWEPVTLCVRNVIAYYCTRTPHIQQSCLWDLYHHWRKYKIQGEKERDWDWLTATKG